MIRSLFPRSSCVAAAIACLGLGVFTGPAYCQSKTKTDAGDAFSAADTQKAVANYAAAAYAKQYTSTDTLLTAQIVRFYDYQYDLWDALGQEGYDTLTGLLTSANTAASSGGLSAFIAGENYDQGVSSMAAGLMYYDAENWNSAYSVYTSAYNSFLLTESQYDTGKTYMVSAYNYTDAAKTIMDLYVP